MRTGLLISTLCFTLLFGGHFRWGRTNLNKQRMMLVTNRRGRQGKNNLWLQNVPEAEL